MSNLVKSESLREKIQNITDSRTLGKTEIKIKKKEIFNLSSNLDSKMNATATKNCITLKGSAQILKEYLSKWKFSSFFYSGKLSAIL